MDVDAYGLVLPWNQHTAEVRIPEWVEVCLHKMMGRLVSSHTILFPMQVMQ